MIIIYTAVCTLADYLTGGGATLHTLTSLLTALVFTGMVMLMY